MVPMALRGAQRYPEIRRNFFHLIADNTFCRNNRARHMRFLLQLFQELLHSLPYFHASASRHDAFGQIFKRQKLRFGLLPGMLKQDVPHLDSTYSEEMTPVPPFHHTICLRQANETLIHEICALEGVLAVTIAVFAGKASGCNSFQIRHQAAEEFLSRIGIACMPPAQPLRDVVSVIRHASTL
ncbi:MAG TPA: hypothetical protein VKH81_07105 [Candidatus Angelobacter sp.]|nr:hypothetical protein [Candidatus Angelobacter sp.]